MIPNHNSAGTGIDTGATSGALYLRYPVSWREMQAEILLSLFIYSNAWRFVCGDSLASSRWSSIAIIRRQFHRLSRLSYRCLVTKQL